jgi:hypothetical protein
MAALTVHLSFRDRRIKAFDSSFDTNKMRYTKNTLKTINSNEFPYLNKTALHKEVVSLCPRHSSLMRHSLTCRFHETQRNRVQKKISVHLPKIYARIEPQAAWRGAIGVSVKLRL